MFKGLWGLYPWFEEDGADLIQSSCRENFRKLQPYGKVFKYINEENGFIEIQYKNQTFKVKSILFKDVPTPAFAFGDSVQLIKSPKTSGVICDIHWHNKYNTEMYFIEIEGKKKASRYFRQDLIRKDNIHEK